MDDTGSYTCQARNIAGQARILYTVFVLGICIIHNNIICILYVIHIICILYVICVSACMYIHMYTHASAHTRTHMYLQALSHARMGFHMQYVPAPSVLSKYMMYTAFENNIITYSLLKCNWLFLKYQEAN